MKKTKVAIEVEIKNIKKIADLKKELKDLRKEQKEAEKYAKTGKFTSKEQEKGYKDNAKAIKEKSKSLRDYNKQMSSSNSETKKTTKSTNSLTKSFVKSAAAIGIVVGAFRAVNRMLSSVITTYTDFEFVMAKVNAVSGATDAEFKALESTAKELGRTTFFTATQVGELQLAFSKLGFTADEIQAAQKATLNLATSTGTDLGRAAQVAGAAVRGFGLDASEAERVVDVMAVSFASSAMDIEKWSTSMTKVAPIAKAAGFSIEDTAAIMSKLTDSGIEASIAGTSLRNILLKMQDPSSDLTKSFGKTIHGLDELIPAMQKFVSEGGSMADIMEVVDLRQAAAFEQMLTTTEGTLELRNALLDASGEGQRMADIVGDTLQGAFLKFTSATQGFAIAFMENFSGSLQKGLEDAARFFNKLTESAALIAKFTERLIQVIKFLGIYKTTLIATKVATIAFTSATGGATIATKRFMVSFRALTRVMMANPYVAVGALLIALATDLFNLRHQVEETDESWEKMNETILGDLKKHSSRNELIETLKGELATVQDLQRGKIELKRIEQELASGTKDTEAVRQQAIKNSQTMFREGEQALADAYVANTVRDHERGLQLKRTQAAELKSAMAIAKKTVKLKDATSATQDLTAATKELSDEQHMNQFVTDNVRDAYVGLMGEVLDGTKNMEDAEQELFDFRVDLLENLLLDESLTYDERMRLEEKLTKLKVKNMQDEQKEFKKTQKTLKKHIKDYGDFGRALVDVAGDNEKLNAVRKAGEAITKAAAIAESILTLKETAHLIVTKKLTLATLLGTKAQVAENIQTNISSGSKVIESGASLASAGSKTVDTGATIANTIATTLSIIPKAISAILSSATMIPFPFNIVAILATMKLVKKVMRLEKGGVLEGDKYAQGGMVQGKSHAQGGEKFSVGGRVVELEGGEAVINKKSTSMFRNQLSAMNEAGGGVKFADGGLLSSPKFTEAQFDANNQAQMMGAMQGQQKVVVVESDITDSQATVSVIQANATF